MPGEMSSLFCTVPVRLGRPFGMVRSAWGVPSNFSENFQAECVVA